MHELSIVTTCRDDNHGSALIDRLVFTLTHNVDLLKKNNIAFEYILVDWAPFSSQQYLYLHPKLKSILNEPYIKNIIVDNSVVLNEKLTSHRFYEFFAKNAGMRRASKKYLFVTNTDILIDESIIGGLVSLLNEDENITKNYFYRCQYRTMNSLTNGKLKYIKTLNLDVENVSDREVCGYCSGDFLIIHEENNIGYNERDPEHRKNQKQAGMDGEILWSLQGRGKKLKFLDGKYGHIEHFPSNDRLDIYREGIIYDNNESWGFVNYPTKTINENTTLIYSQ
jgi:hypothetical protein